MKSRIFIFGLCLLVVLVISTHQAFTLPAPRKIPSEKISDPVHALIDLELNAPGQQPLHEASVRLAKEHCLQETNYVFVSAFESSEQSITHVGFRKEAQARISRIYTINRDRNTVQFYDLPKELPRTEAILAEQRQ